MRISILSAVFFYFFTLFSCKGQDSTRHDSTSGLSKPQIESSELEWTDSMREIVKKIALDSALNKVKFAKNNGMSVQYIFCIDFSIPLFYKRFFIVDVFSNQVVYTSLVSHGNGGSSDAYTVETSNAVGSNCSSLGKYKIGQSFIGEFGKGYRLHGLDNTNSNALQRLVVLHFYTEMPYDEYEYPIYYSKGCPMVSKRAFAEIEAYIKKSKGSILLYCYKSTRNSVN